jgi:hypothetical protein
MEIKAVHSRSRKTYGSPRIHAELKESGHACSKYRVARLMRQHGIVSKDKRKFRVTTNSVPTYPIAESFFHTLKVELIHGKIHNTRQEAKVAIFEYIEVFSISNKSSPIRLRTLPNIVEAALSESC